MTESNLTGQTLGLKFEVNTDFFIYIPQLMYVLILWSPIQRRDQLAKIVLIVNCIIFEMPNVGLFSSQKQAAAVRELICSFQFLLPCIAFFFVLF